MVATVLSFLLVALWLFRLGFRNARWTVDDEWSRVRRMIQMGYRKAMTEHLIRSAVVCTLVTIGASTMTFRYFWWAIAALLFLLSIIGFTISRFISFKDVKTENFPEEDELARRVNLRKRVGIGQLGAGLMWMLSGAEYITW